jgi:NAD(P)-dependent dehydrogenase (short-subunit alcohol dehydrogenase family)
MWSIAHKTVVITGATSGIGLESAAALSAQGARVVLIGRDAGRLSRAAATVRGRSGSTPPTYVCDFASMTQVARLGDQLLTDLPALHVLINNAGSVFARRTMTTDGSEATFAVNHLAHFVLTQRLRTRLMESAPGRVITGASGRHFKGTMDFADLGFERGYQILRAYGRSKLANVLFASALARRLEGTGVTSNSVHPGRVATNIWAGAPAWSQPIIRFWLSRSFVPVEEGAAPVIALATSPEFEAVTSRYFDRFDAVPPSALAQDPALAARLWEESERLAETALRHVTPLASPT